MISIQIRIFLGLVSGDGGRYHVKSSVHVVLQAARVRALRRPASMQKTSAKRKPTLEVEEMSNTVQLREVPCPQL